MDTGKQFLGSLGRRRPPGCHMEMEVVDLDILGGRAVGPWFGYGKRDLESNFLMCGCEQLLGDN